MRPADRLFSEFLANPTFVLTGDQDWSPDWALEAMVDLCEREAVPLHLFLTNPSPALRSAKEAGVTFGIHPNFLPGSTHGANEDEVIATCLDLVPHATTFRCHAFHENTRILSKLYSQGLIADSNLLCFLQGGLVPLIHGTGLLKFPVVFEDDVFLRWAEPALGMEPAMRLMFSPGLKVLNFHPSLVAVNAPSLEYYEAHRDVLYGSSSRTIRPFNGRGVATILLELIHSVTAAGHRFVPFATVVGQAYGHLGENLPDGLYGWRPVSPGVAGRP